MIFLGRARRCGSWQPPVPFTPALSLGRGSADCVVLKSRAFCSIEATATRRAAVRSGASLQFLQDGAEVFPDVVGDDFVAFNGRMDAVREVQFGMSADTFEEKGNESGLVFLGDANKGLLEIARVIVAEVGRHLHACNENLHLRIFGASLVDNGLEVLRHGCDRKAAQAVVAAEFEDEDVAFAFEDPIDPAQPTGGGITTAAGVHDLENPAGFVNFLLQQSREGLMTIQTETCRDAVAENKNRAGSFGGRRAFGRGAGKSREESERDREAGCNAAAGASGRERVIHHEKLSISNMHLMVVSNFAVSWHVQRVR